MIPRIVNQTEATSGPNQTQLAGNRNKIINGAMMIDQRNAGASVTPASGQYLVDRWVYFGSQTSKFTAQQNAGAVTPPVGFTNYQGLTVAAAYTVTATDYFLIRQPIEGLNCSDLAWGTASAKSVTLSFWVYSSLTGTFGGVLNNNGQSRSYPFTYSIASANTWTYITITIPGDTTGTWLTTNGIGIMVSFGLGVGSTYSGTAGSWSGGAYNSATGATSVIGTNGATFYITGVQLEKGSVATPFENRQYGTELALCQRYCFVNKPSSLNAPFGSGIQYSTGLALYYAVMPITMRSAPSVAYSALADFNVVNASANLTPTLISINGANPNSVRLDITVVGATAGQGSIISAATTSAALTYSAEL